MNIIKSKVGNVVLETDYSEQHSVTVEGKRKEFDFYSEALGFFNIQQKVETYRFAKELGLSNEIAQDLAENKKPLLLSFLLMGKDDNTDFMNIPEVYERAVPF